MWSFVEPPYPEAAGSWLQESAGAPLRGHQLDFGLRLEDRAERYSNGSLESEALDDAASVRVPVLVSGL